MKTAAPINEPIPDWEDGKHDPDFIHALPAYKAIATMKQNGKYFSKGVEGWKACVALSKSKIIHSRRMYPTQAEAEAAAKNKVEEMKGNPK